MIAVQTVHLDKSGIEMFIGPLETVIMRALWNGNRSARRIWLYARDNYKSANTDEIAYTSVTSTLHRLAMRQYVRRSQDKRSYNYEPTYGTEAEFVQAAMHKLIWRALLEYPNETRNVLLSLSQGSNTR